MGLSAHINVFNTCLQILADKGYAVRVEIDTEWHTTRSPEEAFAVRAMFAARGELEADPAWAVVSGLPKRMDSTFVRAIQSNSLDW